VYAIPFQKTSMPSLSYREQALVSVHAGKGRQWTKRHAAAAAAAGRSIRLPATNVPGTKAFQSSVGPCLRHDSVAPSWPTPQPWPKPDASVRGAGEQPFHRSFDFRLHDPNGKHEVLVHNSSKASRISDETTLSSYGLLPASTNASSLTLLRGAGTPASSEAAQRAPRGAARGTDSVDELVRTLQAAGARATQFQLGWAQPPTRNVPTRDARLDEEWKLQANDFDPIVTFALHQKKVHAWREEASRTPAPPIQYKPRLQPLPKTKCEEYQEVRARRSAARRHAARQRHRAPAFAREHTITVGGIHPACCVHARALTRRIVCCVRLPRAPGLNVRTDRLSLPSPFPRPTLGRTRPHSAHTRSRSMAREQMREQLGELIKPVSSWIRAREWEQTQKAAAEDARMKANLSLRAVEG
jgi:hypothetical protein